jgi:hypothetical protein
VHFQNRHTVCHRVYFTGRLYVARKTTISFIGANQVCIPYSAHFSCKSFAIIQISSLIESHVFITFCIISSLDKTNLSHEGRIDWSPYLAIYAVGETNIHHLINFLLFKIHIAFLVQLRCISSKHILISSFGESLVSNPYLAQIVSRSTNQT